MIDIYRSGYDCVLNHFHGRDFINRDEVIVFEKVIFDKTYKYAEPAKKGNWAFGGTILFTSNGIFPEFNEPIKLHDRNMDLERNGK